MHLLMSPLLALDRLKQLCLCLTRDLTTSKFRCAEGVLTKGRQVRSCVFVLLIRLRCCCLPLLFGKLLEHCAVNSVEALYSTLCHQLHPSDCDNTAGPDKRQQLLTALHAKLRYRL